MDLNEIKLLKHELSNSIAIINNIAKSTYCLLEKISNNNTMIPPMQYEMLKKAVCSVHDETARIESFFIKIISHSASLSL